MLQPMHPKNSIATTTRKHPKAPPFQFNPVSPYQQMPKKNNPRKQILITARRFKDHTLPKYSKNTGKNDGGWQIEADFVQLALETAVWLPSEAGYFERFGFEKRGFLEV